MEGGAAAAVEVLLQNLIDLCKKEISQIRGLDKDAAKLAGSLDVIKNFLKDAETRDITSDAVKSWLKKLENEAFDADNVLDELNYYILSKKIMASKPMKAKVLSRFSSPFNSIARPRKMAVKIQEINENLESIKKEATELGLVMLVNKPALVIAALETDSYTLDPIFIGRDKVESEIVEMITSSITTDEQAVFILPIVGMGGLGKTTLTRKVFNHEKMEGRFGSRIWVDVSLNFDPIILFKKILRELTYFDQVEVESKQDILAKLKEALKDKTYLLVLDDVWNQDSLKWEDFMNSLSGVSCDKGNAIVVTTRIMQVASIMNTIHIHELKGLSEEECWSIIRAKAFGKKDVPSQFEAIGRKIARRCQGLPLAANIVGGVLRNKSEEKWRSVEVKWLSADEGRDNISKILRLSFDNLSPPFLKKCFAYCAMFPKGSQIIKQELIEMWMAEGFLQADGRDDMESMGELFINILLHNSLLQVLWRDRYGNVECCGMHDLVHDLACFVSSSSNSTGGSCRVRYMILGDDYCGEESSRIPKEMAKSLRTLLITSKADISDINFSDLESLHVLHLHSKVEKLPSSIRKLIHLRDFDISKTEIRYLPDWIGEFFHLQTLRVDSSDFRIRRKVPSTIKYLINLRHLYIDSRVELPMGIGSLTSLQTLKYFPVGDENGCKIEELGSLNNLKGELQILNLERVHDKEEAEKANLFSKSKILNLCLNWNTYGRREGERNDEDVLEGLQPHSDLRKLKIDGFNGKRFPSWTQKMAVRDAPQGSWVLLNNLMSLVLLYCGECEEIPMLGHLPNLKSLVLRGLSNVKCINSSFYGMVNKDTRIVFPALERFELIRMDNLAEWAEIEISDGSEVKLFPRLQHLEIKWCEQLMSVPSHVSSCLEKLWIQEIGVECLPADWLLSNSETLSHLHILNCLNLREISDRWGEEESEGRSFTITSLPIFPRLTTLVIEDVPELSLETVDAMRRLQIDGNKCIDHDSVPRLPLSSLETTARLTIDECDQWSSSTQVELQKENVGATPVENQGSEPTSTSDSTPVPDAVVPKTFPVDSSSSSLSIEIKDSEAKISVKHQREIQEVDEPRTLTDAKYSGEQRETELASSSNEKRSMHHEESIASPIYFQEEGHYLVVLKDTHLRLELINNQSFLIGDSPSAVKHMLNLVEKDLHELPEKPNYPNSLILLLQRNKRLSLIHRSFFDTMPDLSFLDMSDTKIRNLPSSLFDLSKLKVLLLRNCICLEELPHEIGKLRRMEALDLSGTELYELPDEIGELTSLRSMQLSFYGPDDESEYEDLPSRLVSPSFLSELKGIEALSVSVHPEDHRWTETAAGILKDISWLERLSYLRFYFPQVETFERFIQTSLSWKKESLRKFEFTIGQNVKRIASRVPDEVESLFSREERCLRYVNGDKVLPFIKSALTHVTSFYLDHHTEAQSLSEFDNSNFHELKFCLVRECPKMEAILDEENAGSAFPCLEYLGIYFLWELKHIWKPVPQAGRVKRIFKTPSPSRNFEALKHIIISTCPKLRFIFWESMLQCLTNLEELIVEDCEHVEKIIKEENKKVKCKNVLLPRLRKLVLCYLPELVGLGCGIRLSKEKISIYGCPKLIPNSLVDAMRRLTIDECDQRSSLTAVELQKENVGATSVENQGSEPTSTSESTLVPDEPRTLTDAKYSGEQRETEPTSSSSEKRSMHHEESIASPIYFQEEGHYLVVLKDNKHLQLEFNSQSFSIADHPSAVNPMLSLVEKDLHELPEKPNYPNSLILLLQRNKRLSLIHRSFFDTMPDLSFLDMSDTKIRNLPSSLFELSKLKVLLLRNCICLEELPHDIEKLRHMEALDLSGTELYELPDEIGELTSLRSMQLSFYGPDDESEYDDLPSRLVSPSFLSELKAVEALSVSVHPEDQRWTESVAGILKDISRLERLSYLHFYFPQVETFESFIQTSPSWKKQSLRKFEFTVGQNVKRIASRVPDEVESLFSQEERCLRYVNGDKVSPLIQSVLTHVTSFYLDNHTAARSLSEFDSSNFHELRFCLVRECPKMQAILDEENAGSAFPCLEYLAIYFLWELKHIWKPLPQAGRVKRIFKTPSPSRNFEALKHLIISTCPKLRFIFWESMLQGLTNLEELIVEDCEHVEKIIKEENKKVKCKNVLLPRLRKIVLRYLPELVGLGCGIRLSKEKISVYGCPKLIPNSLVDAMRRLTIDECDQWSSSTQVELQKENVGATPVENQGSEPTSTSESTLVPDAVVPQICGASAGRILMAES